jgi:hypothetical protein
MHIPLENELSEGWIKEHLPPNNDDDPNNPIKEMKYWQILEDLVIDNPIKAWNCILNIVNMCDNDIVIANLSAGPLEDLISRHGADFIDLIEKEAKINERFRLTLGGVWKNAADDAVWLRIERLRASA